MNDSPALAFVRHLYRNGMEATGHSWTRLNSCLYEAVSIAIKAGLRFDEGDVLTMQNEMKGGYWFHDGGPERWYRDAIETYNRSAWKALEAYFGREPFIAGGDRLYVGYRLTWEGQNATVTSLSKDTLIACVTFQKGYTTKVAKRYKITRDQLRAALKKQPKPAAEAMS